jgi:hypothetical protein
VRWLAEEEVEEVRDKNFREQIQTSPQNKLAINISHLIFHPPPAVDIYERPQGSDWVEVGRGEGGG